MELVNKCWAPGCTEPHPPSFPYCRVHAEEVRKKMKKRSSGKKA